MLLKIKKNTNFNIQTKLPIKVKVGIFLIVFICLFISLLSFFLDVRYGEPATFINYANFNSLYLSKWVLEPIGLVMAGIGLPVVSCCLQITTKNKLAEPTTLGFYPVILLAIIVTKMTISTLWLQLILSFLFCLVVVVINLLLSKNNIYKSNFKLVLIGFCISGTFTGINWIITTYVPIQGIDPLDWMLGTPIVTLSETNVIVCSTIIIVSTIVLFILIPYLNIIQKDILLAKTLGINVDAIYWSVSIISVFIVSCSIIIAGGVLLLGLVAPHLFRIMFKTNDNKVIMPLSAIFGMFILLSANMLKNYSHLNINLLPAIFALPILFLLLKGKSQN